MYRSIRFLFNLLVFAMFSLSATLAFGQAVSGDITGSVTDQTGAAVPVAVVTGTNEATGVKTTASVTPEGTYRLPNLPVGSYTISTSASGFSSSTVRGVVVTLSSVVTANVTLELGSKSTTVEVSSAGAVIDTTTAQLQTTFEARPIADLPSASSGTGIWNLSLIGAGVASQGGVGQGTGPSISGQRPENNAFNLDGVSNDDRYNTGPLVYVSNESVAEVSLLQNQFSPEFGGGSGGIFNAVVKTGGNALHGSIYEYFQNRNLNAVDSTDVTSGYRSLPRYDNNRLGATIGGPILKDKLFYFGNFEYHPVGQSALAGSPLLAPTAAGYSALAAIPGLSKTNLTQLQTYVPAAATSNGSPISVSGVSIPVGNVSFSNPLYTNSYDAVVAIDYNMSDKDQLRGRYVYNKSAGLTTGSAPQIPAFAVATPNNNYLISLSEFHNFNASVQNEFRGSFSRNVNSEGLPSQTFPGLGGVFPVITIDNLNSITIGPTGPSGSIQNLAQFQDNMVAVLGKHTLKFGYKFTDVILTNYFIQRTLGNYEYSTLQQYLQDLTPDVLGERSVGPKSYPAGFLQNEAFFNDDIRLLPNLTVNLGVRYEYVTEPIASRYQSASAPASIPGVFNIAAPSFSPNDWSPRLGFAYSPGSAGAWSIRGGFARAFDLTYANLTSNAAPPYFQQTTDVNLTSNTPSFLANGGIPGGGVALPTTQSAALALVSSYTFSNKRPYGLDWNLGVQHVFHKDYTFEARYVGTRGVHLWNQTRLNIFPQVSPSNYIPTYFTLPSAATLAADTRTLAQVQSYIVPGGTAKNPRNEYAVYGSSSNIVGYAPQGVSSYHGLQLQLNRRFTNNLSFIAAYTWSHLMDDATATNFSTYLSPRRAQDFQNLKSEWASSALDHRQRFTFTPIYDFKPFRDNNWLLKNLVGNWSVSGTYTYETPEYATVQSNVDSNLNGDSAGDRTIINPAGTFSVGSGVTGYNSAGQAVTNSKQSGTIVAYVANNPNARFVVAGVGALANSGRNNFPLAPTNNIDLALRKQFNFSERIQFSIGAQAYNVLNHSQFTGGLLSDVASHGYTTARNDLVPSDPLFGNFTQFYSSNSRTMQLTAKLSF